jgi:FlaA1/EpsC-like NDP-sugar epimerase
VVIGGALLSFLFIGCYKMLPRVIHASRMASAKGDRGRVLIVGAGLAGATLAARLLVNGTGAFAGGYSIAGFVDDDPAKWARRLHGKMVFGPIGQIPGIVRRERIDLIILALPSAGPKRTSEIIALCQQTTASVKILPSLREVVGQVSGAVRLRDINVADLLGREVVPLHTPEAHEALTGKIVLVTGAAGSIGSELCRQLVTYAPATVIALDNNETGLFDLAESLRSHPEGDRIRLQIGDITNARSMERLFERERPHVIFHAAAYKHVPLLEQHPDQAIRTNVLATHSLCHLARQYDVGCFCFISSDKAADPVNVLGASKRAGEIVVQAMAHAGEGRTRFCAVRFGNVIGSRGSVVPLFTQQIEQGGPVTITDAKATRYFMTIPEACGLVIVTSTIADSGGLFILDMGEPVGIADLAVKMITLRGLRVGQDIPVVYTGLRPGERMHEILAAPGEDLVPTSHGKIRHVASNGGTPTLYALGSTMHMLEQSLEVDDSRVHRDRLFDAIHDESAIASGAASA